KPTSTSRIEPNPSRASGGSQAHTRRSDCRRMHSVTTTNGTFLSKCSLFVSLSIGWVLRFPDKETQPEVVFRLEASSLYNYAVITCSRTNARVEDEIKDTFLVESIPRSGT